MATLRKRLAFFWSFLTLLPLVRPQVQLTPGQFEPAPYINAAWTNGTGASVSINTKDKALRNNTAPYLSGILFEDISHSGDGGIYAELVRNRAFQGSAENLIIPFAPTLEGWYPVGDARLSLDLLHPLSDALQVSLQVDIPLNATGEVGFHNDGFWGMAVTPQTYNASFFVQANGFRWNSTITHIDVSLRGNATGSDVFVSSTIDMASSYQPVAYQYRNYSVQLVNNVTAPTSNNSLYITMNAEELRGQTLYFDLISLFPETYKNRPNGLRKDLAENFKAGNFRFLRFPGGNNLEGYSIQRRWKWWQTTGPLMDRPGRPGDWTYYNTDGLGLLEYMYWCEDMDLVPVLGVYAGFSLDIATYDTGYTNANEWPVELMQHVLQEALDELEYLTGNTSTYWGAQRAAHGHVEPFDIPFVEIGNEDFFSYDYPARAAFMLNGLKAAYPNITYIYTTADLYATQPAKFNITLPKAVIWDDHVYAAASYFVESFDQFDNWQSYTYENNISASNDVYASLMEYHVSSIDNRTGDPTFDYALASVNHPRMLSAVAEAVYALGWERNPDTFKLSAFAPAIQNVNFYRNTPYLMLFSANPNDTVLSTGYYQEQMFNTYYGTQTLPFNITQGGFNPLFFAAQIDVAKEVVYLKVVNAGHTTQKLTVELDMEYGYVNGTILEPPVAGDLNAFNYFGNPTAVVPQAIDGLGAFGAQSVFSWQVPAYSVSVLEFSAGGDGGQTAERIDRGSKQLTTRQVAYILEEEL
ncbi:glycoside hydrolase family 51 protein [Baudoinia panamericana UAMH 10762]|uniref:non-reducing end alpha-L-arabinofuranosidase n=1 Tax=Baudoinia panamericana (strain UAMH 10762) TaxID=717646 RepID=M2N6I3_BAUPA|nr:glycoside hydrolase family 51 protein [Baudoinia panamericana UAMH 10762]EMC94664.1 glycoside hydrolase family 51 protein [Baudoinia panamericana UAMH 10762]